MRMPPRSFPALSASPEALLGTRRRWLGACVLAAGGWSLARPAWAQPASGALSIGVLPNVSARILLASYQPMREKAFMSTPSSSLRSGSNSTS